MGIKPAVVRVFDPGDDGVLGASNLDERALQSVAGEKLCWGSGMTIFGLMAEIVYPLCWGYEMTIFGRMAIRSAGDRNDHFRSDG